MSNTPTKIEGVEYVYAGALLHNEEVVYSYIPLKDGVFGKAAAFARKLTKHEIGSVISFTALDTEDNIVPATGVFVRMWDDADRIAMWIAMSEAILTSEDAYTAAMGNPNSMMSALSPLRDAYIKLGVRERAILLGQISAYVAAED